MPATDLSEAVLAHLRADAAVTSAFGDTWNATTETGEMRLFYDFSGQADEPYLVCGEIGETYDFMTPTAGLVNYIATGQQMIEVYAPERKQARSLGVLIGSALNDAALTWLGCHLMEFRIKSASFVPVTSTGPNVPIAFHRVLIYDYVYSGVL